MKISSEELIADLQKRTGHNIIEAEKFHELSLDELNWRTGSDSWSVLECVEHLNYYGEFYLSEIEKRIRVSTRDPQNPYKSGFFGNYFAKMMLPGEKQKKIKTFRSQDPIGKPLDKTVIDRFLVQQQKLFDLLERAEKVSLSHTKTSISISEWIKLRLGDTFRVVVYHNGRHILQANNVLRARNGRRE